MDVMTYREWLLRRAKGYWDDGLDIPMSLLRTMIVHGMDIEALGGEGPLELAQIMTTTGRGGLKWPSIRPLVRDKLVMDISDCKENSELADDCLQALNCVRRTTLELAAKICEGFIDENDIDATRVAFLCAQAIRRFKDAEDIHF